MATTALFVELVVIGLGPLAAIFLVIFGIFGYGWVPTEKAFSLPVLLPLLAMTYLLGIIVDRIADKILGGWGKRLRRDSFDDERAYRRARSIAYADSPFRELFEYSRSRLRIARGWILNSLLIIAAGNYFVWNALPNDFPVCKISLWLTAIAVVVGSGSLFAWRQLVLAEIENIETQSKLITERNSKES
jgi:hypothetical protein